MRPAVTIATARRVLSQLRHDRRTLVMLLILPAALIILLRYVLNVQQTFNHVAPALFGIFPFLVMFLVTSVATLRERTSGTLERLMTMPISKIDLLLGYAIAFGLVALLQIAIVATITLTWLGMPIAGPVWMLLVIAVLDALLGTALGLFASAFARTEFQAMQLMPLVVMPQALLCGLFVPRDHMATVLNKISDAFPLSYAVDAMKQVTASAAISGTLIRDLAIMGNISLLALIFGAATLRRRTP